MSRNPRVVVHRDPSETTEIVVDFESDGVNLDAVRDPSGSIVIPALCVLDSGFIGVNADLEPTFSIDTLVLHGDTSSSLQRILDNDVLREMHTTNGLVDDLRLLLNGGATGMTFAEIEDTIRGWIPQDRKVTVSGSGVAHFDLPIIRAHMPRFAEIVNFYPNDVGSERRGYRRAIGRDLIPVNKEKNHRGYEDALKHLSEMQAFMAYHRRAEELISRFGMQDSPAEQNVGASDHDGCRSLSSREGTQRDGGSTPNVLNVDRNHRGLHAQVDERSGESIENADDTRYS